jgi:hypothetical protein
MSTPEGRLFREVMAHEIDSQVWISGYRPCSCGKLGCGGGLNGVAITINGCTVLAREPQVIAKIIETLMVASKFAWGMESGPDDGAGSTHDGGAV